MRASLPSRRPHMTVRRSSRRQRLTVERDQPLLSTAPGHLAFVEARHQSAKLQGRKRMSSCWRRMSSSRPCRRRWSPAARRYRSRWRRLPWRGSCIVEVPIFLEADPAEGLAEASIFFSNSPSMASGVTSRPDDAGARSRSRPRSGDRRSTSSPGHGSWPRRPVTIAVGQHWAVACDALDQRVAGLVRLQRGGCRNRQHGDVHRLERLGSSMRFICPLVGVRKLILRRAGNEIDFSATVPLSIKFAD